MDKNNFKHYIRIGGILLIICAVTALALALVNSFTKDKIAENSLNKMNGSISEIFGDDINVTETEMELKDTVSAVYEVSNSEGNIVGYAVNVVPSGFKGDIEMMVGVNTDGTCRSVKIISHDETPGLGAKITREDFISQYENGNGNYTVKDDITPIAGATISSKAVTNGVNTAMEQVKEGGLVG